MELLPYLRKGLAACSAFTAPESPPLFLLPVVVLAAGWVGAEGSSARDGILAPGDVGVIVETDSSAVPYKARTSINSFSPPYKVGPLLLRWGGGEEGNVYLHCQGQSSFI